MDGLQKMSYTDLKVIKYDDYLSLAILALGGLGLIMENNPCLIKTLAESTADEIKGAYNEFKRRQEGVGSNEQFDDEWIQRLLSSPPFERVNVAPGVCDISDGV